MLAATDYPAINAMCEVSADMLRQAGMTVDYQAMDWGSVLRRMLNRDPPDKGGFNAFCTFTAGVNQFTPAAHNFIRGSGLSATPGWSTSAGLEALRTSFFDAPDDATRAQIGREHAAPGVRRHAIHPAGPVLPADGVSRHPVGHPERAAAVLERPARLIPVARRHRIRRPMERAARRADPLHGFDGWRPGLPRPRGPGAVRRSQPGRTRLSRAADALRAGRRA